MFKKSQIGLIGLAVMGANLARNLASKDFQVSVYNRTFRRTQEFLDENYEGIMGFEHLKEFLESLERPRKIILMVKSGQPVDDLLISIGDHLEEGDIVLDCGNSNWKDTQKRQLDLVSRGIQFIGCGVSGGEEGALHGPSIMPGGKSEAVKAVLSILEKIAAKDFEGRPCVTNIGLGGAGHFVKMVHNGIEYALMQGIAEIYDILKNLKLENAEITEVFRQLNTGANQSFLLDITVDIFGVKDNLGSGYLVDKIIDKAGSKGTGRWTIENALELGVATPTIASAFFARNLSGRGQSFHVEIPEKRTELSKIEINQDFVQNLYQSLNTTFLCSYFQGLDLIIAANKEKDWQIDLSEVIRIWQGGCIIRSQILKNLNEIYNSKIELYSKIKFLENTISMGHTPKPVLNSVKDYILTLTAKKLPTNLIQAQRDFFGAHTYQRSDKEGTFSGGWIK